MNEEMTESFRNYASIKPNSYTLLESDMKWLDVVLS